MSFCQECPEIPETPPLDNNANVDEDEFQESVKEIFKLLQADACEYKSDVQTGTQTVESGSGSVGLFGIGADYAATSEEIPVGTNITEIGCETIDITARNYTQSKSNIVNILSCSCSSTSVDTSLRQKMKIILKGVRCEGNLMLSQQIKADVNMVNEISAEQETAIQDVTKQFLASTIDTLIQDIENSGGSSEVSVTASSTELKEEMVATSASTTLSQIAAIINSQQEMEIVITDSFIGGDCSFDQNLVLKVIASQILSTSLKTYLESLSLTEVTESMTVTKTKEQDTAGSYTSSTSDILSTMGTNNTIMAIVGVIGTLLVLGILFKVLKSRKEED